MNRSATAAQGRTGRRLKWGAVALLTVATGACGGTPGAVHGNPSGHKAGAPAQPGHNLAVHRPASSVSPAGGRPLGTVAFTCKAFSRQAMVQGSPHVTAVPSIESVQLLPRQGGLDVVFRFRSPVVLAPAGVYLSWSVYLYHHRGDVGRPKDLVSLQFEDRGLGWEPTGWTILASVDSDTTPVAGSVRTDASRDELTTFFPAGFTDLRPPFFWYASQEAYRAFLPEASKANPQNWSVNGSVTADCPAGVRHDIYSLPEAAKLLVAAG